MTTEPKLWLRVLGTLAIALGWISNAAAQGNCPAGIVCGGCAFQTQTVTCTLPPDVPAPGVRICTVPAFNSNLGTLISVTLNATIRTTDARFQFENLDRASACQGSSSPTAWTVKAVSHLFEPSAPANPWCDQESGCNGAIPPLPAFDGALDFCNVPACTQISCTCGSGYTFNCPSIADVVCPALCITDPTRLGFYQTVGPGGTVDFQYLSAGQQTQASLCGKVISAFRIKVGTTVTVTYKYCNNAPPVAAPDSAATCPGVPVIIPVLNNDTDPNNNIDCAGVQIVQRPANGVATPNVACGGAPNGGCATSCVRYAPTNPNFVGTDTFTYRVIDAQGCASNVATVTVTINPPPNAANDTVATCKGVPIVIGILQNDVPAAGTSLVCNSVSITDRPDHGSVSLGVACGAVTNDGCPSSCVRYTPNAGFSGTDTFTYSVTDSRGCVDTANVTVTVRAGPNALPDSGSTCQGQPIVVGILQNDVPEAGSTLACGSVAITTQPTNGAVALNVACGGTANDGCPASCVRYTPSASFSGTDTFQYTVTDSNGCVSSPATVTITVNPPPNAVNDSIATCKGVPVVIGILQNDVPAAGTTLVCGSVVLTVQPTSGAVALNFACGGTANDGCPSNCVRYTPNANFTGTDTFTYSVTDSRGCVDTAVVTVTVRAGPNALPDSASTCQGEPVVVGVLQNDVPEASSTLTCGSVAITTQPTNGAVALNVACGGTANDGCPANCVRYTPNANFSGTDTFQYTVTDSNGCVSSPATVTITVNPPPNAVNDSIATCKGVPVVIGILQNDVPAAGTTLVCASVVLTVQPTSGAVALNIACGGTANDGCPANCVRYTPNANFTGTDTFTYSVTDSRGCKDTAVVTVTVRAGPNAVPDSASTCQDEPLILGILQNDVPEAGSTLTCGSVVITTQPTNGAVALNIACAGTANDGCPGNCVRYLPNLGFSGTDTFQYTVTDSNGCVSSPATVTITVNPPPNAVNDSIATCKGVPVVIGILQNDVPAAGTTLVCGSVVLTVQPTSGAVALNIACGGTANDGCPSNCVRYTPNANFTGTDTFTYSVTDSRGCKDTAVVTVTVRAGPNAAPDSASTCQGEPVIVGILQNDVPEAGSTLTCGSVAITTQPTNGAVASNIACGGTANDGCPANCVRYTPNANFSGTDTFKYTVTDSNGCVSNQATVTITVNPPPDAVADAVTTCKNTPIVIGVLQNDVPAAGTTLACTSLSITVQPTNGVLTLHVACGGTLNDGCPAECVRYTPNNGFTGSDGFQYSITDSRGCKDTAVVLIRVCAPVAAPDPGNEVCQLQSVAINVLQNDSAQTSCGVLDCGSITIVSPPSHGIAVPNANCTGSAPCTGCRVVYTHNDPDHTGADSFTYTVKDTFGCVSNVVTVGILVKPSPRVLDRKVLKDPASNAPIPNIPVLDGATPGVGCTLIANSLTIISGPTFGQAVVNANGTITYTPGDNFPDEDTFCFRVQNSCGCFDEGCVEVNEPPPTCIDRHRRQCGSLLLYPEYSNRQGELTLFTITDACCDVSSPGTYVEFIFIQEGTCLEENRTFFLTQCDTLTFVTNFAIGNTRRGYAYAYAKIGPFAGQTPKVFNHLIGQELFLDGWSSLHYGMNAVSFKGIGPEGSLNDEDNDGVRDLDGVTEYEEAPDRILVPRFMGQDLGLTGYNSSLILIALSGGTAFNFNGGTEVLFGVFDDNENANSVTYKFYCWKKPKLREISNVFLQSFLASPIDNPDEIVGRTTREAGWFWVDGLKAHSNVETINDPAIYAVLVEQWNNTYACELPFESCSQQNGDLLPDNLLGDPRPGFPLGQFGDDQ